MMSSESSSQSKRVKNLCNECSQPLCALCCTPDCTQESSDGSVSSVSPKSQTVGCLPEKQSIGKYLSLIPNEVIYLVLKNMSLTDLSNISITNKWFRNFTHQYFFESKTGLASLLETKCLAINAKTKAEQTERLREFFRLGLLLKRFTCLYPTNERISILVKVFARLDGIPRISLNPVENQNMKFVFRCYGTLIRHLVSGWDDCELELVFKTLQRITQMNENIRVMFKNPIGARNSYEYYIRCFYRMLCSESDSAEELEDKTKSTDDSRAFWIKAILRKHRLSICARLMLIIFGPHISPVSGNPATIPYIGYWDLTDTFFIEEGMEELGDAFRVLYTQSTTTEERLNVISLMECVMEVPTNWLPENLASLLFYAGDELTFDYLLPKLKKGNYAEVAQKLVFLTLVTYKLTKDTKYVYNLIEELATKEHFLSLYNEIKVAFIEAIAEVQNVLDLDDERDVWEIRELVEANNDLLEKFMIGRRSPDSSQNSKNSQRDVKDINQTMAESEE